MPKTDFPMRGGLPNKEPQIQEKWDAEDQYKKALEKIYPDFNFEIPKVASDIKRRYDIIKKLYNSGKIVVVRYGNTKYDLWRIGILTNLKPENNEFPYIIFRVKNK